MPNLVVTALVDSFMATSTAAQMRAVMSAASAAQGALADTALQPNGNGAGLSNVDAVTLNGATFAAPGAIGGTTPGTAVFSLLAMGSVPITSIAAYIANTNLVSTSQGALVLGATFSSAATASGVALNAFVKTAAAAFTMTDAFAVYISSPQKGAGSAITNLYGLKIEDQSAGATLNYAIFTGTGLVRFGDQIVSAVADGTAPMVITSTTKVSNLQAATVAPRVVNSQAGNYTLVLADRQQEIQMTSGSANTLTVPPNSSVAFAVGTQIPGWTLGAGQTTLTPGSGVTLNSRGGALKSAGQFAPWFLEKTATDVWAVGGDLTT